jgi:hypothetical protein
MNDPKQTAEPHNGLDAVIEAYKKDVDMTLIRENLRLSVDQRFQQLMKLQQFAEELHRAGRKPRPKDLETIAELERI